MVRRLLALHGDPLLVKKVAEEFHHRKQYIELPVDFTNAVTLAKSVTRALKVRELLDNRGNVLPEVARLCGSDAMSPKELRKRRQLRQRKIEEKIPLESEEIRRRHEKRAQQLEEHQFLLGEMDKGSPDLMPRSPYPELLNIGYRHRKFENPQSQQTRYSQKMHSLFQMKEDHEKKMKVLEERSIRQKSRDVVVKRIHL